MNKPIEAKGAPRDHFHLAKTNREELIRAQKMKPRKLMRIESVAMMLGNIERI